MGISDTSTDKQETQNDAVSRLKGITRFADTRPVKGRVTKAVGTIISAVVPNVRIGEICILEDSAKGLNLPAEVIGLTEGEVLLTPLGALRGLSNRTQVQPTGAMAEVPVGEGLLGRIMDGLGKPMDGLGPFKGPITMAQLHANAPDPMTRQLIKDQIIVGLRSIDGFLTCGLGQRLGIYGEPGDGKSTLISQIVKGADVDVAVVALIGERGREVREFIEHQLGPKGRARSVLVVATSDRPAIERVRAAYSATSIAEYFRDRGKRVLLIMDSVTRFARAQREIGLSAGEPPTRRGFPPSVFALLPQLMERAGPGAKGSITAFYSVLVEGDGTGDPIAEETRGILDGHIILSRKLAAGNHYPAIDILASRSRIMNTIASKNHKTHAAYLRELMAKYAEVEFLIQVGEYKKGSDAKADEAIAKIEAIRSFLKQATDETTHAKETLEWMSRMLK